MADTCVVMLSKMHMCQSALTTFGPLPSTETGPCLMSVQRSMNDTHGKADLMKQALSGTDLFIINT